MKYYVRFCKCGTIHCIENSIIYDAIDQNKNIILICANCGDATVIGADTHQDYIEPDKMCHDMYSYQLSPMSDLEITDKDFNPDPESHIKPATKIIYSHGHKVPMKTGYYASNFSFDIFSDMWYPDFYKIQRKDVTVPEIMKFINNFNKDRTTVDMNRLINEIPDDKLQDISKYYIKAFNWKGTKYETEWNSDSEGMEKSETDNIPGQISMEQYGTNNTFIASADNVVINND